MKKIIYVSGFSYGEYEDFNVQNVYAGFDYNKAHYLPRQIKPPSTHDIQCYFIEHWQNEINIKTEIFNTDETPF